MILEFQLIPEIPNELLVAPAIMPAIAVPCQFEGELPPGANPGSVGSVSFCTKSYPANHLSVKSG